MHSITSTLVKDEYACPKVREQILLKKQRVIHGISIKKFIQLHVYYF